MEMEYGRLSERLMEEMKLLFALQMKVKGNHSISLLANCFIWASAHYLLVKKEVCFDLSVYMQSWALCVAFQVELSCPKEMAWKVNMHRGYLAICHPEEQQLNFIERLVETASSLAIREWRRLPHIVSHVHTPLLQVSNTKCMESTHPPPLCTDAAFKSRVVVIACQLILISSWKRYVWRDHQ